MRFLFDVFTVSLAAVTTVRAGEFLAAGDPEQDVDGYVVMMEDDLSNMDFSAHRSWAASAHKANAASVQAGEVVDDMNERVFQFHTGLKGYGASINEVTAKQVANRSEVRGSCAATPFLSPLFKSTILMTMRLQVKYVEPDQTMTTQEVKTQDNPPSWGLVRISHADNEGDGYGYDEKAGEGITIYGIDTGIDIDHPEFDKDRASWGKNFADDDDKDGSGHGTHTASTIVGKNVGVAKKAKIIAVKVLDSDGNGKTSDVISGVEWAANNAKDNNHTDKAVINLSLGGKKSKAYNDVVDHAAENGIFIAAAAGNNGQDSAGSSPASAKKACAVGATDKNDKTAEFSSYGKTRT